jgi:hypothetical protein
VFLYLFRPALCSESVLRFFLEQHLQQTFEVFAHVVGNVRIAELDLVKELRPTFGVKRRQPHNHFINQGSQTPPINRFSMSLFIENLRGKVLRSATDRKGIALGDIHFGESKISESQIADFVNENILWF